MSLPRGGLPPVHIGDVDDPTTFWITPVRKFDDPKVKAVMELEQHLSQFCETNSPDNQGLRAGSLVAVRRGPGSWLRGRVEHLVTSLRGLTASIFLVDWGKRLHNVPVKEDVTRLPSQISQHLEELAHKLVLNNVVGPFGEDVSEAVRILVNGSQGVFVSDLVPGEDEGVLRGGLYLDLPFEGDCPWRRSIPQILIQLLDGYNTDRIYINGLLNDLVKLIQAPMCTPREVSQNAGNSTSLSLRSSEANDKFNPDHGRHRNQSTNGHPANRIQKSNDLPDSRARRNRENFRKMDGTQDMLRNKNPDTSTPLNSSNDRDTTVKPKPPMGRGASLQERIRDRKVGLHSLQDERNNSATQISDISALDQSGIYGFQGTNSSLSSPRDSVNNSMSKEGVKITPGGGDSSSSRSSRSSAQDSVNSSRNKDSISKSDRGDKRKYQKNENVETMLDISCESGRGVLNDGVYRSSNKNRRNMANSEIPLTGAKERLHKQFKLPERMFGGGRTLSDEKRVNNQPSQGRDLSDQQSSGEQEAPVRKEQLNVQLQKWRALHNQPPKRMDVCSNQSLQNQQRLYTESSSERDELGQVLGFKGQVEKQYPREGQFSNHSQIYEGRAQFDNQGRQLNKGRGQIVTPSPSEANQRYFHSHEGRSQLNNPSLQMFGRGRVLDNQVSQRMFGRGRGKSNYTASVRHQDSGEIGRGRGQPNYTGSVRHQDSEDNLEMGTERDLSKTNEKSQSFIKSQEESQPRVDVQTSAVTDNLSLCPENFEGPKLLKTFSQKVPATVSNCTDKPTPAPCSKLETVHGNQNKPAVDKNEKMMKGGSDYEEVSTDIKDPANIISDSSSEDVEDKGSKMSKGGSSPSANEIIDGGSGLVDKPKLLKLGGKTKEAALSNTGLKGNNKLKALKNDMKAKLKKKISKLKENEEVVSQSKDVSEIDDSNKDKSETTLPSNTENESLESDESASEQVEEGEDPLEALIRNFNKISNNETYNIESKKVSLTMSGTKFDERFNSREAWTRLLMHRPSKAAGGRPCKLADHTNQLSWHGELLRYLREAEVTYSTIIQSALWPAVTRLMSVVGVAAKCQGKTNGWTLPLLSNLSDHDHYLALPPGKGPTAVVLAAGWKTVGDIAELLEDISKRAKLEVSVAAAYSGREKDLMASLINGVDVLVATPCCILRLINEFKFTDLERCCHFVVEEADRLLEWFPREVELLLSLWKKVGLKFKGLPDQTIVVAERWSEAVKQFVDKHREDFGLIVLGSLLEGVVYGQLKIYPHFFEDVSEKWEELVDIVQDRGENRLCICCRDAVVGTELVNRLSEVGLDSLLIDENDDPGDRGDKLDMWRESHHLPLVLTDMALMFVIDPIPTDILVHWDLPNDSKKEFGIRFVMLKPAMKSFFGEANPMPGEFRYEENNMDPENASVHLMLCKEDGRMLRTFVHLLKRTGTFIPQGLKNFYFELKKSQAKDAVLSGQPLCSQLATRGICRDRKLERCNERHFLHNEMDQPMTTTKGDLHFLVLYVETPVRYWVRIKEPVLDRKYQSLVFKLGRYYSKESNMTVLTDEQIVVGQVVVARSGEGFFRRARVVSKLYHNTRTKKHILKEIQVFLLDEGHKEFYSPGEILELCPHLRLEHFPPSAAAVVVAGLLPQDRDSDWSVSAAMFINNKLKIHSDDHDIVCRGKVLLAIGNTYWINKCQLMVKQGNIGKFICAFETRDGLLENNHAVDNSNHMDPLYEFAARAGIARPEVDMEVESVAVSEVVRPEVYEARVAFLPRDAEGCKVFISECYSPGRFYVHKVEHSSRLTELERDMEIWAKENGSVKADWRLRIGEYVMARRPEEDAWLRGRVENIFYVEDEGVENAYSVFFVDIGDVCQIDLSNVIPMEEKFVKRLPLQAVKCSLAYIKPIVPCGRTQSEDSKAKNEALSTATEIYTNIVDTAIKRADFVKDNYEKSSGSVKRIENEVDNSCVNDIDLDDDNEEEGIAWCREAGDLLFDLSRDVEDNPVQLWCKVEAVKGVEKDREYEVRLFDVSTGLEVGMKLVEDGLAEDKMGQLSIPVFQPEEGLGEGDGEEEDWENSNHPPFLYQDNWENPVQLDKESVSWTDGETKPQISLNPEDYDLSLGGKIIDELSKLGPHQKTVIQKACLEYMSGNRNRSHQQSNNQSDDDDDDDVEENMNTVKSLSQVNRDIFPEQAAVSPFVPPTPLRVRDRPSDIPAPCPTINLCAVEMKKPTLLWSQDPNTLRITVTVNSMADIKPHQVYLRVDSQGINIQVLEILETEEFIIHTTELLKLFSKVCTHGTTLKVLGRSLVITLVKRTTCHWRQLTKLKRGWIKVDHDKQFSSDSEDETRLERLPPGFMGDYVTHSETGRVHAPRYNIYTGEQALPELMFTSSDEAGSEDQDLEYLDDGAVDCDREDLLPA